MNESKKGEAPDGTAGRSTPVARFASGGVAAARQEDIKSGVASGAASLARDRPDLELHRQAELSREVEALRASIGELHRRMEDYGRIEIRGAGVTGRIEGLVKSLLRKLILRHLDQEKEVHRALAVVLDRLTHLIEAEQLLADRNAERLVDASVRQSRVRSRS